MIFINNRQQMRSLSVKQQPTVNFTYQSSPTKITSNKYVINHPQPDIIINSKSINNQSFINRQSLGQQRSHIKIVQSREEQSRRERKHRIFQNGSMNRLSKSKQRNRSYTIFNGIAHESTNKIKDIVFTKQSGKQQSVQTDLITPKQPQNKISTFNPSPPKPIIYQQHHIPQSPLQIQQIHHQSISLQHLNGANSLRLQQQLSQREREVKILKLELERYERCNRLTLENQFIYKKLVERLDQNNRSQYSKENIQEIIQNKKKVTSNSPQSDRIPQNFSQTTRFLYPSSQKKYSNKHKSIGTILSQVQPIKNIFQQSPPRPPPNSDQIKTITFQKTHHNKIIKNEHHHRYPSPFSQQNESLTFNRIEYARQLSNTIELENPTIYDRLSQMNRNLQGKIILRSTLHTKQAKYPSIERGRVCSMSSSMHGVGALKYLV